MKYRGEVIGHLMNFESSTRHCHDSARRWFEQARYGLFVHYGLYTQLGRGEWAMYHERISLGDYARLKDNFDARNFSPERIVDLAVESGMKYINLVTKHHDGFCLFETAHSDFHSLNSPAGRDLVREFAQACQERGLGLFLYYSYGVDWRHAYSLPRELYELARPDYTAEQQQTYYRYRNPEDFRKFIDDTHAQLTELLTNYGAVAGVWFDLISACYFQPDYFPVAETYALIRELQPHALISFKQGFTGDEDFMSQELEFVPLARRLKKAGANAEAIDHSNRVWEKLKGGRNEICTILQDRGWAWVKEARHFNDQDVWKMLANASARNCNLLLNTGPLPDGSLHPEDVATLRRVGERIRQEGFPEGDSDTGAVLPMGMPAAGV